MVWMQTKMPVTPALPGYDKSGWCCFESSVCSLQKHSDIRLDLANFDASADDFDDLELSLKASRAPPVHPHDFSDELQKRTFTGRGDQEKVKKLYTKVFNTISACATELSLFSLSWGDNEAVKLACVGVRGCHRNNNKFPLSRTGGVLAINQHIDVMSAGHSHAPYRFYMNSV